MGDYGHELEFGSFITPANHDPHRVVDLAVTCENASLDLVTFQDHPYHALFLDAWTVIAFVAARTERIHIAPNVVNLPMRPPSVLARSVISLDLLTGGRIDLGLGAGAFWDAIEAFGGRRLGPGDSVKALDEAIDIIRGIWDAGEERPLKVEGEFYRVDGAKRGPAPAHDVPIWLGAYKPRMLRLTGRKGDGWVPSLGYLPENGLRDGNAIIDEAAEEAGRAPGEIRRLLDLMPGDVQGPPSAWAGQLVPLALEHGVGTFILATDDASHLEAFGREVAPAVREAVAKERA